MYINIITSSVFSFDTTGQLQASKAGTTCKFEHKPILRGFGFKT